MKQKKLTKELSGWSNPDGFWKVKNQVRIVESFSLMINIMEDLLELTSITLKASCTMEMQRSKSTCYLMILE